MLVPAFFADVLDLWILLDVALWALAVAATVTVAQRIWVVRRQALAARPRRPDPALGSRPDASRDGPHYDRAWLSTPPTETPIEHGTSRVKRGMAEMLKGGVIMDVVTADQAKIAEDAGAVAVMALERVPADIRAQGGVSRMSDPDMIDSHHRGRLDPGDGQGPHRPLRRGAGPPVARRRLHRRVRGADPGRLRQPHRQVGSSPSRSSAVRPTWARPCAASPRARR